MGKTPCELKTHHLADLREPLGMSLITSNGEIMAGLIKEFRTILSPVTTNVISEFTITISDLSIVQVPGVKILELPSYRFKFGKSQFLRHIITFSGKKALVIKTDLQETLIISEVTST